MSFTRVEEPRSIWSTPYASDAESTRSMPAGSTSPAKEVNKKSMLTRRASSLVAKAGRAPAAKLGVKREEPRASAGAPQARLKKI